MVHASSSSCDRARSQRRSPRPCFLDSARLPEADEKVVPGRLPFGYRRSQGVARGLRAPGHFQDTKRRPLAQMWGTERSPTGADRLRATWLPARDWTLVHLSGIAAVAGEPLRRVAPDRE